ncbi:MAG: 3'(2'),5'-bisphosphate nucleotidase [Actinomycetota bacterium]
MSSTPHASADRSTLGVAVEAVRRASAACVSVQHRLAAGDAITKGDDSPVTAADFAAQAVVCATLVEALGTGIELVGEEDSSDLTDPDHAELLATVQDITSTGLGRSVAADDVVRWIDVGASDGTTDRYWTLDPIDGTKGFLRGDQFAVALALIDEGQVVLGVLGCPNLPTPDGGVGAIFAADAHGTVSHGLPSDTTIDQPIRVASPATVAESRFCESVESGHSDHSQSQQIADLLGITSDPYRIDSQCKYAAVARGDASIYLRLPTRADYVEKIWDHAAGKFVVERAGGTVSDVEGRPLDFSHGARLSANRGVVATSGAFHDQVIDAVTRVLNA